MNTPDSSSEYPRRRARFTVAQFHQLRTLADVAACRPVLLSGVIWEYGPMGVAHANALLLLTEAVRTAFGSRWVFRGQLPLPLDLRNDPFPDLAVAPGAITDYPDHPTTAAFVAEVADDSQAFDLTIKAEAYATAGIADYWVLDVVSRELHVFRDPAPLPAGLGATAYRRHTTLGPNDTVSPLAAPSAAILVADMLP